MLSHLKILNRCSKMAPVSQACSTIAVDCNTLVFIDLETTGLIDDPPVRITELHLCSVEITQFLQGMPKVVPDCPRVYNSLNLCINPTRSIHPMATTKSKLDILNLEHQNEFDEDIFNSIFSFLNRLKKPICLVAHNGFKFDFPILRAEIAKLGKELPEGILCADSLDIFLGQEEFPESSSTTSGVQYGTNKRKISGGGGVRNKQPYRKGFTLDEIFQKCYDTKPLVSHQAEGDVLTLLYSAMSIRDEFVKSVNASAKPLASIDKCW